VARDHQLLDTARDYFHFTTTFFEVIDVSATHVYHSALELSPLSSIVRRFYYYQRPHLSPRVVVGIPDSWDPSTAASTKHSYYLSSAWSPCGQFIAAVAKGVVEIRDAHTLELLSTPQPTKVTTTFRSGLAYSPDGCSLAGCSDTGIVIWDTQTGGVIKVIECEVTGDGLEPVWSLDGETISTISPRVLETITVHTYDIASGTTRSPGILQSNDKPYLWAHGDSFRIATTTTLDHKGCRINIFEVGPALTKIESFSLQPHSSIRTFSPTAYRISISVAGGHNRDPDLLILDVRNSEVLLRETGGYWRASFSPDGTFFAAFAGDCLSIWKYASGRYTRWREFQQTPAPLQFSPTSSSILGRANTLHVLHLDYSPAAPTTKSAVVTRSIPRDAYSPHVSYIATTHRGERVITITNLRSQNPSPSQFIDTGLEISEIVLTGNVLLVKSLDTVAAWLLTEEGVVDGLCGNKRADRNDRIWDMSSRDATLQGASSRDKNSSFWARLLGRERDEPGDDGRLEFSVGDGIAAVGHLNGFDMRIYDAATGEILKPDEAPLHPKRTWYRFQNPHRDECDLYHRDLRKHHEPVECDWPVSQTTLQGGWVKDPEGKHRFWLHPRWRSTGNDVDWLNKPTALRLKSPSELVVIKF
jgi:WD40 repeat protein